jgi:glycerophosphoryl diester phosphodiesterase
MNIYQRRTFLKTSLLAAAATVTTPANAALRGWDQDSVLNRGIHHPFFAGAKKPDVIAHRGGNGQWPGETMYAMRKAQALGCDVLEMDVYLTGGLHPELVLMHDIDVHKTTAGKGQVYDYTVEKITALRADRRWSPDCKPSLPPEDITQHEDELRVPTLPQVLKAFPEMRMIIEMKKAPMEFSPVARLCQLLKDQKMTEKVLVASFHAAFMDDFRRSLPEVATSLTLSIDDAAKMPPTTVEPFIEKTLDNSSHGQGPDALQLPYWVINKHIVNKVKERGLALHAWTVNKPKSMERMKSLGVDGIITDCPTALLSSLGRLGD